MLALCALNAWLSRKSYDLHTYQREHGSTQIDFILTRRTHADHQARQAAPVPFDLTPWRGGSKHKMVAASLPLHPGWRRPVNPAEQQKSVEYSKSSLDQAVRNTPALSELQANVSQRLAGLPNATPDDINYVLLAACAQVFPRKAIMARAKAWMQDEVQGSVRDMWAARHELLRYRQDSRRLPRLGQLLHAWRKVMQLQRLYRQLKQQGQQARRRFLHGQLQRAQQAAEEKDQFGLHSVIREISPKCFKKAVHIRDTSGNMLTVAQEFQEITKYFSALFQSNTTSAPNICQEYEGALDPLEVSMALRSTKLGKAVPTDSAPASVYRACEGQILDRLTTAMPECYRAVQQVPRRWLQCHLALLPKPHKSTRRPEKMRPLGIQDVAAKTFSRVIRGRRFEEVKA